MTVERDRVRQRRYWEIKLDGLPAVPRRPEECFQAFREILFQSVECRLDRERPVAALLSGGLDSSAIVSIASRYLAKQNRELTAVSAVPAEERATPFAGDREYIDEFRSWPNVRIRYVTGCGRGPFDSLDDPGRFAAFPLRSSRFYLNEECEKAALASGARTLLWGSGGEFAATAWASRYYLELALGLRCPTLVRELKSLRSVQNVSPFRTLAGQLLRALLPLRGQTAVLLLTPEFRSECRVGPAWKDRSLRQRPYQAASLRYWLSKHALARGQTVNLVPPRSPLLDKRILEFCLALPAGMNVRDGYQRYLIRRALDGVLPPRIQWRTSKAHFSPDYYVRYNAQLGMARSFVAAIGSRDPVRSVIDVNRIEKMLIPVDVATVNVAARDDVPVTLYTINFLRQFPEFQP
jgi:asparagine synthase (glutamine-hydrolysing)